MEWGGGPAAGTQANRRRRSLSPAAPKSSPLQLLPLPLPQPASSSAPTPAPVAQAVCKKKHKDQPRRPKVSSKQQQETERGSGSGGGRAGMGGHPTTPGNSCGSSAATESATAGEGKRKRPGDKAAMTASEKPLSRRSERPLTAGNASKASKPPGKPKQGAPSAKKKKKPLVQVGDNAADDEPHLLGTQIVPVEEEAEKIEKEEEEALPCQSDSVHELFVATDLYSSGSDCEVPSIMSDSQLPSGERIEALSHSLVKMEEDDDTFHDVTDELLGSLQSASAPIDIRTTPFLEFDDMAQTDSEVLCSSMTYGTSVAGNDTISVIIKHIRRQNRISSCKTIDDSLPTNDVITSLWNKDVGSQTDSVSDTGSSKMLTGSNIDENASSRSDEYESISCGLNTSDGLSLVCEDHEEIIPSAELEKRNPPFSSDMLFSDQSILNREPELTQDITTTSYIHDTEELKISESNVPNAQTISLFISSSYFNNNCFEVFNNCEADQKINLSYVSDCVSHPQIDSSKPHLCSCLSLRNVVKCNNELEVKHNIIYSENTDDIIIGDDFSDSNIREYRPNEIVENFQTLDISLLDPEPEADFFLDTSLSIDVKDEESSALASDDSCSSGSEDAVSCVSSQFFGNALLLISPSTTDHDGSTSALESSSLHGSKSSPSVSQSCPMPRSAQTTTCSFSFPEDTHPPYLSTHEAYPTSDEYHGDLGSLLTSQKSSTSLPSRTPASKDDHTLQRSTDASCLFLCSVIPPRAGSSHVTSCLRGDDESILEPPPASLKSGDFCSATPDTKITFNSDTQSSVCVFLTSSSSKDSFADSSALDTAHDVSSSEFLRNWSAERLRSAQEAANRTCSSPQLHDEEILIEEDNSLQMWEARSVCGDGGSNAGRSCVVHVLDSPTPGVTTDRQSIAVLFPSRLIVSEMERESQIYEWLAQQDVASFEKSLCSGGDDWSKASACHIAKYRLRAAGEGVSYYAGCAALCPAPSPAASATNSWDDAVDQGDGCRGDGRGVGGGCGGGVATPDTASCSSDESLVTAESCCEGSRCSEEVMIVVCCSDTSCVDSDTRELASHSHVCYEGKLWEAAKGKVSRLRSPWYAPDLVSDLPEGCSAPPPAAGRCEARHCGDCRRETWRRAQVLLRRPESAPTPVVKMAELARAMAAGGCCHSAGAAAAGAASTSEVERIVCAPVKDRIQIFNSAAAAAPHSRPVSAQRSAELDLGLSSTRVKERILAFNAGLLRSSDAIASAPAPAVPDSGLPGRCSCAAVTAQPSSTPPSISSDGSEGTGARLPTAHVLLLEMSSSAEAGGAAPDAESAQLLLPPTLLASASGSATAPACRVAERDAHAPSDAPDPSDVSPINSVTSIGSESPPAGCTLALLSEEASESSADKMAALPHDGGRRCAVSMALAAAAAAYLWYAYK